jgi:hypothetical protein
MNIGEDLKEMMSMLDDECPDEVYVVMAHENPKDFRTCYAVCNSRQTAQAVIDKDERVGDIQPGASIEAHVMQTKEMV